MLREEPRRRIIWLKFGLSLLLDGYANKGLGDGVRQAEWILSQILIPIKSDSSWSGLVAQACPTLGNPMDCSTPGSSVQEISQARILEWVTISFSRGSSWPRDQTGISCIGRKSLYPWATWESFSLILFPALWLEFDPFLKSQAVVGRHKRQVQTQFDQLLWSPGGWLWWCFFILTL